MEEIICPACGATNPVESTLCESCGEDLGAIRNVVDTANTHYNEAIALAHQGRLDEAIGKLEAALSLSDQNPQFYNLLGTLYGQKGEYEQAIDAWERAIAIDPELDKAYRNIDKARKLVGDDEEDEEGERRPFLLAAIGAGVLALILLATTGIAGMKAYQQKESILSLNNQVSEQETTIKEAQNQLEELRTTMGEIEKDFPGGIVEMKQKYTDLQTQLANSQQQNQRLEQQRTAEVDSLRTQIEQMKQTQTQLQQRVNEVNQIQSQMVAAQTQAQQLQQQLAAKDEEIEKEKQRGNQQREATLLAQETTRSVKADRDKAVANLMKGNDKAIAEMRQQMIEMRDEVAAYEKRMSELDEANALVAEALTNIEGNNFNQAQQNVNDALEKAPNHAVALHAQQVVQSILSDPVEQELRRNVASRREQDREAKRAQLVQENLQTARAYYERGQYDLAARAADQAMSLSKSDPKSAETARRLKQDSIERNRELSFLLIEARKDLEQGKRAEAQTVLNQILKRAPTYAEALELQKQLTQ